MRRLILIFPLISITSLAEIKPSSSNFSEVLSKCNHMNHQQCIKRYSEIESKVIEAIENNPKITNGPQKELFEIVFPQDLPKEHGLKGAFLGCFDIFHEYQKAINNVQSLSARKNLELCYDSAYRTDPPPILGQYMECLKKIKY